MTTSPLLLLPLAADAAEEGIKVITGMLIVGLIFIGVIALGELSGYMGRRRKQRRRLRQRQL